jgi:hypothetical protein
MLERHQRRERLSSANRNVMERMRKEEGTRIWQFEGMHTCFALPGRWASFICNTGNTTSGVTVRRHCATRLHIS